MSDQNYAGLVLKGATTMIVIRWLNRGLGMISISITARLLTPDDFGVMGSAALVMGMFLTLRGAGLGEVIVHLNEVTRLHLNTVWTLKWFISAVICALLIFCLPYLTVTFDEPRLHGVLLFLILSTLIGQMQSPGTFLLLRQFAYKKILILRFSEKLLAVCATILLAVALGDYWALVYGQLVAAIFGVFLSYWVCPFWPSFTLAKVSEVRKFAFWSVWRDIAVYFAQIADELVVRLNSPTETFAYYRTGRDLSRMGISELVAPAASPVFAALSRLQADKDRFVQATTAAIGLGVIIALPAGIGFYFLAADAVAVLLGPQWVDVIPVLQFLALGVAGQTLAGLARSVYAALGKQNLAAIAWTIRALCIGGACLVAAAFGGLETVAKMFALTSVLLTLLEYWYLYNGMGQKYPVGTLYLGPAIACSAMALFLVESPFGSLDYAVVRILLTVPCGILIYASVLLWFWKLRGSPSGPITAIIYRLPEQIRSRFVDSPDKSKT